MVTDSCCSYSTFCDPYLFCHIWQPSSLLMAVWTYTWRQGLPHVVVVAWMSSHLKLQMSLQPSQLWSWQQRWHTKQHGLLFQNKTFVVQASGKHLKHYTELWPVRVCVCACQTEICVSLCLPKSPLAQIMKVTESKIQHSWHCWHRLVSLLFRKKKLDVNNVWFLTESAQTRLVLNLSILDLIQCWHKQCWRKSQLFNILGYIII